jgi:type I restriction enzyme S subunit
MDDFLAINKRSKVDYGDILMPMIGTIGNPVIVEDENPLFAIKNVALIKNTRNSPSPVYLKAFLQSDAFKNYVAKVSRGGTQKFLGLSDIRALSIPLLKKDKEEKFAAEIEKITSIRNTCKKSFESMGSLFNSLQNQSFAVN